MKNLHYINYNQPEVKFIVALCVIQFDYIRMMKHTELVFLRLFYALVKFFDSN